MKKLFTPFAAGLLMILSVSCTTSPSSGLITEPVDVAASENVYNSKVIGTWRGLIPCADCPGISYNLTLNDDNSFEETRIYQDRSAQPFTRMGTWQVNNGILELDDPEDDRFRFSLTDEELVILDNTTGRPVETKLTTMYRLRKDSEVDGNLPLWNDSTKQGVDFVGNGNDPGWLVEVDLEKGIFFKTLPIETVVMTTSVPLKPAINGNSTTYRAETEAGEQLVVVFTKQTCTDSMSGKASDYTVEVTAKGTTYKGCGVFLNAATTD